MATDVGRDEAAAVEALLPDLRVSNAIIGDASALSEAWRRDGYWFFRGVLDPDALATFRRPVLEELKKIGVVDDESELPLWNGRSMQRFPVATHAGYEPFPALVKSRRWREFLADPRIAEFFTKVIGSEVHWVPVAELRVNPPREVSSTGVFTYPHQDGFYNEGYRCLTAWMPLWPASRAAGGLAVAEGMHRGEYYHDLSAPPQFPIPPTAIPMDRWRTADYLPGDAVIFDRKLPHSGLRNSSEREFRVSFDVRCILPGDPAPVLGHVVIAAADSITIRQEDGRELCLPLDDRSYCRGIGRDAGRRLLLSEVPTQYQPGQEAMITLENGSVRLLREPKY